MRVGFIGLGHMGAPMARRLVDAGFHTTVWNRSPARAAPLDGAGAAVATDPVAVGKACEVVGLCLPTGPDCEEVLVAGGLLDALPEHGIVVDHSTIGPADARALAALCEERGRHYLDAPVSGGPPGAAAGTLCVMVGGATEVLERARPAIDAFAGTVVHVGAVGSGQVAKLANNLGVMLTYVGIQEAFEMALRHGVDPRLLLEVMQSATARSHTLDTRAPVEGLQPGTPASSGWGPGFATDMMMKDIGLVLNAAQEVALSLPGASLGERLLRRAHDQGLGDEDFSAFAKLFRG